MTFYGQNKVLKIDIDVENMAIECEKTNNDVEDNYFVKYMTFVNKKYLLVEVKEIDKTL